MAACLQGKAMSMCRAAVDQREVGMVRWVAGAPPTLEHTVFFPGCCFVAWAGAWHQSA